MQKRVTVIRTEIARLNGELAKAQAVRGNALAAVAKDPANAELHATLNAAADAVNPLQQRIDGLESALETAEAHDRADELDAKRGRLIEARKSARDSVLALQPAAAKLESAVGAVGAALRELDGLNDAAVLAIADAGLDAIPDNSEGHLPIHASEYLHQLLSSCATHLRAGLSTQFVLALFDAGLGRTGFNLDGSLEFAGDPSARAFTPRLPFVETVQETATAIDRILCDLHMRTGVIDE
ncbi:hypothetical protein PQR75_13650 [Paraburkholderia fungorum]|uniref:hypothetical protein n=1 Tax=Paraburkholderia fungorum TaxID=134537 RepID=UPI0038B83B76